MSAALSMKNKVVVVTGATSGLGYETAIKLYQMGAFVIGVGRDANRCEKARNDIISLNGNGNVTFLVADLSSLRQVEQLAKDIIDILTSRSYHHIDALINNAGAFCSWLTLSPEGYELQFAVNHLAPFYLTHLLLPYLQAAEDGRVVTLSSGSHYHGRIHFKDVHLRRMYNPLTAYKQSKTANVIFTQELNRRGLIKAYAADPGLVNTDIGKKQTTGLPNLIWRLRQRSGAPACDGCLTSVHLATMPTAKLGDHIYFKDCKPKTPDRYTVREEPGKRLWELSLKMCGIQSGKYGTLSTAS